MKTTKLVALLMKRSVIFSLGAAALAFSTVGPLSPPVVQAQGPPDFAQQHQRMRGLFEVAGVVFTDADETTGRLVVGVLDRGVEGLIRARLPQLGVASQFVDVVETEPIFAVTTLRDKQRPVIAGVQIRFSQFVCSLGYPAQRDGVPGFVTASHCSDAQGAVDETSYYQPLNQVADEFIGTEIADPAYLRTLNGCPRGRKCRYSDANFSQGSPTVAFSLGRIAKTTGANNGSLEIAGEFTISGEATATVGSTANKVGRTTGWTQGTVTRTCTDTGVSGSNIVLLCQDFVESSIQLVAGGDSGSPVFRVNGSSSATLLGNLWGGNSSGTLFVYSRVGNVKQELGGNLTIF
jgi:hypothetical protein